MKESRECHSLECNTVLDHRWECQADLKAARLLELDSLSDENHLNGMVVENRVDKVFLKFEQFLPQWSSAKTSQRQDLSMARSPCGFYCHSGRVSDGRVCAIVCMVIISRRELLRHSRALLIIADDRRRTSQAFSKFVVRGRCLR